MHPAVARLAERSENGAGQGRQRVRRRRDRHVEVDARAAGQVAPPDERIEGVVVDEAAARERPGEEREQRDRAGGAGSCHGPRP